MNQHHAGRGGCGGIPAVVVGVDGSSASDAALTWAVHAAVGLRAPLHLVHAFEESHGGPEMPLLGSTDPMLVRRELLGTSLERVTRLVAGRVPVTGRLHRGPIIRCLVDESVGAALLVVGRHERNGLTEVVSRSLSARVAARARCPVVVVPTGWEAPPTDGPVTAGVDAAFRSHAVLRGGLRLAAAEGRRLRVLHLWRPSTVAEPASPRRGARPARTESQCRRELEAAVDQAATGVPGVEIEVDVQAVRPSEALIAASRESALVVVGRRDRLLALEPRLGSVAGHVLRRAACPVVLVPPEPPRAVRQGATQLSVPHGKVARPAVAAAADTQPHLGIPR